MPALDPLDALGDESGECHENGASSIDGKLDVDDDDVDDDAYMDLVGCSRSTARAMLIGGAIVCVASLFTGVGAPYLT